MGTAGLKPSRAAVASAAHTVSPTCASDATFIVLTKYPTCVRVRVCVCVKVRTARRAWMECVCERERGWSERERESAWMECVRESDGAGVSVRMCCGKEREDHAGV